MQGRAGPLTRGEQSLSKPSTWGEGGHAQAAVCWTDLLSKCAKGSGGGAYPGRSLSCLRSLQ